MNTNTLKKKNVTFPVFIYIIISIHSEDFSQLQLWVCLSVCNIFDTPFKSANNRTMDYGTTYHVLRTKVSNMVSNSGMQECGNIRNTYHILRTKVSNTVSNSGMWECGNAVLCTKVHQVFNLIDNWSKVAKVLYCTVFFFF